MPTITTPAPLTDDQGRYVFRGFPPGCYRFLAYNNGVKWYAPGTPYPDSAAVINVEPNQEFVEVEIRFR